MQVKTLKLNNLFSIQDFLFSRTHVWNLLTLFLIFPKTKLEIEVCEIKTKPLRKIPLNYLKNLNDGKILYILT